MKLRIIFGALVALSIAVMFANIGGLDVYALDEAKNAEAARYMYESGNYVVPFYNGDLRTDKPPLHYYFMAAGYSLFGVNAFGARFFSSLFGVLTIVLTFLFVLKHFNTRAAILSSLVLIASLHFNLQFHMSVPDPYLIFFITWAYFSFYDAYKTGNRWQLFSFYFAIGCGLLTKGPIAVALPGLTAVIFLLLNKDFKWKTIWRMQPFGGLLLSLMVALPWYYEVHKQTNGAWTEDFFFKHNFSRYSEAMEGHEGIFIITFAFVFVLGMLTFLPFVFQSIKYAILNRKNEPLLYSLIAALVVVIFFASSSTKLPNYTVPSYPVLAVVLGFYLSQIDTQWFTNKWNKLGLGLYSVLLVGFPAGIYFGLKGDPSLNHLSWLGVYFIILTGVGIYNFYTMLRSKNIAALLRWNVAGWIATILLFFYLIFPQVDAENPVRKLVPQMETSKAMISYARLNPAFVFALEREIPRFSTLQEIEEAMSQAPSGYVISRTDYREELEQIDGLEYHSEAKDLFENPTTLVMKWGKH
ncbi:glycosyltransferase family 39 protein [uncultured Roseivirga sp.]|uniref:ArnT family glycosyltransferase n=1 Tax=uncultured Roseivirga sp. TaxID=543088 RepID=UPI002584D7E2|nr:glycosyltransferase family 39 protein [uncultured Roseivirga sp.]